MLKLDTLAVDPEGYVIVKESGTFRRATSGDRQIVEIIESWRPESLAVYDTTGITFTTPDYFFFIEKWSLFSTVLESEQITFISPKDTWGAEFMNRLMEAVPTKILETYTLVSTKALKKFAVKYYGEKGMAKLMRTRYALKRCTEMIETKPPFKNGDIVVPIKQLPHLDEPAYIFCEYNGDPLKPWCSCTLCYMGEERILRYVSAPRSAIKKLDDRNPVNSLGLAINAKKRNSNE